MRIRLAELASTNSWNQVVLGSFMKMFTKQKKIVKEDIAKKKGKMTFEEVKAHVNANPFINECIDKKRVQQIIEQMNPQKIAEVETQISNKIITDYEKEKDKSKKARFEYLQRKALKKREENKTHDR